MWSLTHRLVRQGFRNGRRFKRQSSRRGDFEHRGASATTLVGKAPTAKLDECLVAIGKIEANDPSNFDVGKYPASHHLFDGARGALQVRGDVALGYPILAFEGGVVGDIVHISQVRPAFIGAAATRCLPARRRQGKKAGSSTNMGAQVGW